MENSKIYMLVHHEKNALCEGYIVEFIHDAIGERSNFKKIILRTRKIMVMHSNERGECCPCTLVDRKWKR